MTLRTPSARTVADDIGSAKFSEPLTEISRSM